MVSGVGEVGLPRPEKLWRNFDSSGETFNESGGPVQIIRPTSTTPDTTVYANDIVLVAIGKCG